MNFNFQFPAPSEYPLKMKSKRNFNLHIIYNKIKIPVFDALCKGKQETNLPRFLRKLSTGTSALKKEKKIIL